MAAWPLIAVICAGLVVGIDGPADADETTRAEPLCIGAQSPMRKYSVDRSRVFSHGVLTLSGWRIPFRDLGFVVTHRTNPALTQAFYSAGWMVPTSRTDVPAAIQLLGEMAAANPDPGASIGRRLLPTVGWSEAAVTLRLKTALCLYALAETDRMRATLLPALEALIAAAKDAARYYGPPHMPPHNHGVLADRELLNAAAVLDRPELAEFAQSRLERQIAGLYDSCGFSFEQSNGYQHLHASLWDQIARREVGDPVFRQRITKRLTQLREAADAVTFPDGFTPVIGDGAQRRVEPLTRVSRNIRILCPETGWFSWRHTAGDLQQQVIARFGPGTRFHGHADKGSVVWFAKPARAAMGVSVL
jgi:hypothetical protein